MTTDATRSATYREILQQPEIWTGWSQDFAADAARLKAWIAGLDITEIWLSGAGTSAFIGDMLAACLGRFRGVPIRSVPSTDLVSTPRGFAHAGVRPLVISFGRSGNSAESIGTLDVLDALFPNAARLNITCNRQSVLATRGGGAATKTVILPEACHDAGFAMTSSFSTMVITAAMILSDRGPAAFAELAASVDLDRLTEVAAATPRPKRAVFVGSGSLAFAAREAALKVMELAAGQIPALWDSCLGFRHGPKSFVMPGTRIFAFLSTDAHTRRYDDDLVAELRDQFGADTVTSLGAGGDVSCPAALDDDLLIGLWGLVLAQLLAVHWSAALGLNIDDPFAGAGTLTRVVSGVTLYPIEAS